MSDLLSGQGLAWGIWDRDGVVATAVRDMIDHELAGREVRARMLRSDSPRQLEQLANTHRLGLAIWVVVDDSEIPSLCQAMVTIRQRHPDTLCVCYLSATQNDMGSLKWPDAPPAAPHNLSAPRSELVSLLVESGAQLLVDDLPTLQLALPRVIAQVPLASHGYHPLTTGLLERLPWGP